MAACIAPDPNANAYMAPETDINGQQTGVYHYYCDDYYYPDPAQSQSTITCNADGTFSLPDGTVVVDPSTQLLACLSPCEQADLLSVLAPTCDPGDEAACVPNGNPCDNGNANGRDTSALCSAIQRPIDATSYTCTCDGGTDGSTGACLAWRVGMDGM